MTKLTTRQADKLIEAAQNAVTFQVTGKGQFPIDMLRYDLCWPATGSDSTDIEHSHPSSTILHRIDLKGLKLPTAARWESFGWKLVQA
jgi:hypothetical protein